MEHLLRWWAVVGVVSLLMASAYEEGTTEDETSSETESVAPPLAVGGEEMLVHTNHGSSDGREEEKGRADGGPEEREEVTAKEREGDGLDVGYHDSTGEVEESFGGEKDVISDSLVESDVREGASLSEGSVGMNPDVATESAQKVGEGAVAAMQEDGDARPEGEAAVLDGGAVKEGGETVEEGRADVQEGGADLQVGGAEGVKEEPEAVGEVVAQEEGEEDVPTFEEFKQKKLQEQESVQRNPQDMVANIPKTTNNYASLDCGSKVIAANAEARNTMAVLQENRDVYMLNPCSAKIWFVVELCELVSVSTLEIGCFELFSSIPKSFNVYSSESHPTQEWDKRGTFHAANERTVQSFPLATDENVYAKYIKVEMLSHYGTEHYCPLSLVRVLGASMMEVYEYTEGQKEHQQSSSVVLPASEGGDDELLIELELEKGGANGTIFSAAKDAVLSILDKPLSLLGKVNGILKPDDKKGVGEGCLDCEGGRDGVEDAVEIRDEVASPGDTQYDHQRDEGDPLEPASPDPASQEVENGQDAHDNHTPDTPTDGQMKGTATDGPPDAETDGSRPYPTPESGQEVQTTKDNPMVEKEVAAVSTVTVPDSEQLTNQTNQTVPVDDPPTVSGNGSAETSGADSQTDNNQVMRETPSDEESLTDGGSEEVPNEGDTEELVRPPGYVSEPEVGTMASEGDSLSALGPVTYTEGHLLVDGVGEESDSGGDGGDSNATALNSEEVPVEANRTNGTSGAVQEASGNGAVVEEGVSVKDRPQVMEGSEGTQEDDMQRSDSEHDLADTNGHPPPQPQAPNGSVPPGTQPTREKSVFVRLSNRIRDVEENMTLFSSYLDQISTSLKKNKNRTEDAQKSLEKRMSALNESLLALREEVVLSTVGLQRVYGELLDVVTALTNISSGLESLNCQLSNWPYWWLTVHLVYLALLLLFLFLWMARVQHSISAHVQQLVAHTHPLTPNHVAPGKALRARGQVPCLGMVDGHSLQEKRNGISSVHVEDQPGVVVAKKKKVTSPTRTDS